MENFEVWLLYFTSLLAFAGMGYFILTNRIIDDYELKQKKAIGAFVSIFAFCVNAMSLILFEIFELGTLEQRLNMWVITLSYLVYCSLFLVPAVFIYKCIAKLGIPKQFKLVLGGISALVYLVIMFALLLQKIRSHKLQKNEEFSISDYFFTFQQFLELNTQIDLITKIGTYLIAILSGFGAVYCPFSYFNFYYSDTSSLQDAKLQIDKNIQFLVSQIAENQYQIIKMSEKLEKCDQEPKQERGFFSKLLSFASKSDSSYGSSDLPKSKIIKEINYKKAEIKTLSQAHIKLFQSYCDHSAELYRHEFSTTLQGKFFKMLSFFFSFWCSYKILMSTFNYIVGRKKSIDPINRILKITFAIMGWGLNDEHYQVICNYFSFGFTGFLIFSNTRSFSLNVMNFLKLVTGPLLNKLISSDIIVYFISEIFGVYFLSTLILMQSSIADAYLVNLKTICGEINIYEHYSIFDLVFIISAFISLAILYINLKIRDHQLNQYKEDKTE